MIEGIKRRVKSFVIFLALVGVVISHKGRCWIPEGCPGTDYSIKNNEGNIVWLVGNLDQRHVDREVRLYGYESVCTFLTMRPSTGKCFRVLMVKTSF